MKSITINDINATDIEIYHHLRENKFSADGSFIADSPKVVNLLLESDIKVKSILATKEYYDEFEDLVTKKNIPIVYLTTKEEMGKIVGHKIHHNCMMHGVRPKDKSLEELGDNIIMLDNITSSENVGSIARSAAALGVNSYLLPTSSPHPFNRRALRVSMGHTSLLKTSIYEDIIPTIKSLQDLGYKVFAAEISANAVFLSDVQVPKKWVILMGHEGKGIDKSILDICNAVVSIEMQAGIKSFNVGVAAALMMYKFTR
jgi:tRNA G18 (ribose-2'-O)-methylase SpoU